MDHTSQNISVLYIRYTACGSFMLRVASLLIIILVLHYNFARAQTDTCIANLKSAGVDYDDGNFDRAIKVLNATLAGCPLSKQDRIEAGKLLILSYLSIDNLEAADASAMDVMKVNPNYTPDKFKDDPRLSSLFEKFRPEPTLALGINGGINWPIIDVVQTYSVVHADDTPGLATYESNPGYQFGIAIEKRAYKDLWIELEFGLRSTRYTHTLDSINNSTVQYKEKLTYFDLPLSLKYYFLQGSLKPYLQAGVDFSFLGQALSTTTRDDQTDLVNRTALRNTTNIGYFGTAGVSYAIKAFGVFANVRYTYFPDLVNKEGTRYADDINLYKYYYIDDDFRMDNLQINAGAYYTLAYRTKK